MKINQLIENLQKGIALNGGRTCDVIKVGSGEEEIRKVAVSMFATPDVIRAAADWGANFLIIHEPLFYDHWDDEITDPIGQEKKRLIQERGLTIYRYHDYPHCRKPDMIYEGNLDSLGLPGERVTDVYWAVNRFVLDTPMTARELAAHIEKTLDIRHVRIAGCLDRPGRKISCCFGTPGHIAEELHENDFVLTGEICEWREGEIARDYAQLGYNKAILVLGHIGSEREGMKLLARLLQEQYPDLESRYFECGEVYRYTEQR